MSRPAGDAGTPDAVEFSDQGCDRGTRADGLHVINGGEAVVGGVYRRILQTPAAHGGLGLESFQRVGKMFSAIPVVETGFGRLDRRQRRGRRGRQA